MNLENPKLTNLILRGVTKRGCTLVTEDERNGQAAVWYDVGISATYHEEGEKPIPLRINASLQRGNGININGLVIDEAVDATDAESYQAALVAELATMSEQKDSDGAIRRTRATNMELGKYRGARLALDSGAEPIMLAPALNDKGELIMTRAGIPIYEYEGAFKLTGPAPGFAADF